MALVYAPRVNINQYDKFAINDLYGLNFLNTPYDQWWVVETSPNKFALNVVYRNNDGGLYTALITFRSDPGGFTYSADSPFPVGIVSSVSRGIEAYANLPRIEDVHFRVDEAESLGLSVFDVLSDPLRLFAGDDTIMGGDNDAACDEISAGAGNDTVVGARTDGWYDMGLGDGMLDGGAGYDIALFDMSDRARGVTYVHDNTEAVIRVGGADAVIVRNIEQVEIRGSAFYDHLTGGSSDDILDLYLGGGLADGGGGDDLVRMSFADMTAGVEYVHSAGMAQVRAGTVVLAELRNVQRISMEGGQGNDHLAGGTSYDELFGGAGDDHLEGGDNNDLLEGGAGNDRIDGGDGHDYFRLAQPGQVDLSITGPQDTGDGRDTLVSIEGVYGSAGDDRITGGAGDDSLYGDTDSGPGGDVGNDIIDGGAGNDFIIAGRGVNHLYGGAGDDYIYGLSETYGALWNTGDGENFIHGGDGNDQIYGANGNEHVFGGDGDDRIDTAGGLSWVEGGNGNDAVFGGWETDIVYGGEGNDGLNGHGGDDILIGGDGDDGVSGWRGNDILDGGAGNDQILGGWGDDLLIDTGGDDLILGDDGFDIVDYSGAGAGVEVRLYTPWNPTVGRHERQNTGGAGNDILEDVEGVVGTAFNDRLIGRNDAWSEGEGRVWAEYFDGGAGDDVIDAGSGADLVLGGAGDDLITGGKGNDILDGGSGQDVVIFSGAAADYRLLMNGDNFILKGPDGRDDLTNVEIIRFGDGRELELNRLYGTDLDATGWAAGRIPEHLLSNGTRGGTLIGDRPHVMPGADDAGPVWGKGFDQPEVMPTTDGDFMLTSSLEGPLVLPAVPIDRLTAGLFALGDRYTAWRATIDGGDGSPPPLFAAADAVGRPDVFGSHDDDFIGLHALW